MNPETSVFETDLFEGLEEATETVEATAEDTQNTQEEVVIQSVNDKPQATTPLTATTETLAKEAAKKLGLIQRELQLSLMEREEEIKSLMLGIATGKHVLFLGDPGTGKSMLVEQLSKHVTNANYFQWLLNKTSDPSELLGPISIKGMENDQFLRKPDGKLPEAHFAFIDEVYKSNSPTLNVLLSIMNEGVWYNDGKRMPVNLNMLVGASNEEPEEEGLAAFHDRFIFRHWVDYVGDAQNQFTMLRNSVELRAGRLQPTFTQVSLEEIKALQEEVAKVEVTDATIQAFQKLILELKKEDINVSDRRLVACVHIMQAEAYLNGRTKTSPDDMEPLAFVLWERKDDIEEIQAKITKMMNPFKDKVMTVYKEAVTMRDTIMSITDPTDRANKAIDTRNVLEKMVKRMENTIQAAASEGRDVTEFNQRKKEVEDMLQEIVDKCLFSFDDMMGDDDVLPF